MNNTDSQNTPHIPDLRTYAYHQKAAEILKAQPERLDEVYNALHHWQTLDDEQLLYWVEQWLNLLDGLDAVQISELIVEKGQTMDLLRKSSPFATLLTEEQRIEIIHTHEYDYISDWYSNKMQGVE